MFTNNTKAFTVNFDKLKAFSLNESSNFFKNTYIWLTPNHWTVDPVVLEV